MKKTCIAYVCFLIPVIAFSQQGRTISAKSVVKQITYKKEVISSIPFYPMVQISHFVLNDENKNSVIEPGEKASFDFWVKNAGSGIAEDVIIKLSIINVPVGGPEYVVTRDTIASILPDQTTEITIALSGLNGLNVSPLKFLIYAYERTKMDAVPFEVEIEVGTKSQSIDVKSDSIRSKGVGIEGKDTIKSSGIQPSNEKIPGK